MTFIVNAGLGSNFVEDLPISVELCDHSDKSTEGEEKENGESDDIFKHDHKAFNLIAAIAADSEHLFIFGCTSEHLEILTPPPEFL